MQNLQYEIAVLVRCCYCTAALLKLVVVLISKIMTAAVHVVEWRTLDRCLPCPNPVLAVLMAGRTGGSGSGALFCGVLAVRLDSASKKEIVLVIHMYPR
jgi:hypothetical protein